MMIMKLLFGALLLMLSSVVVSPSPQQYNILTVDLFAHVQTDSMPSTVTLESPYPIYPSLETSYMKIYAPDTTEVSRADPRYLDSHRMSISLHASEYGTYAIYWRVLDSQNLDLREGITTFAVVPAPPMIPWCDTHLLLVACLLFCLFLVYEEVETWRNRNPQAPPLK